MTIEQTVKIFNTLKAAYPRMEQFDNDEVREVWATAFADLDGEIAMKAVWECIKTQEFMPSIAQVIKAYDEIVKEEKHQTGISRQFYEYCRGVYPKELPDNYGWQEFIDKVNTAKPEKREIAAQWIFDKMRERIYSGETVPDFIELIKETK